MENIKRKIRLFFVEYGNLIFSIIGIFVGLIIFIQILNNIAIEEKKKNTPTEEKLIIEEKNKEEEETQTLFIADFINCCNTGKIEEAYDMVADECKRDKYGKIEEFKNEYINKVFKTYICDYEIDKQEDIYIVTLLQDLIIVGKEDVKIEQKYKITEGLNYKIYIYH